MNKIKIGIISRAGIDSDGTYIEYISEEYRLAILKYGGIPLLILPPGLLNYYNNDPIDLKEEEKLILNEQIDLCDGILFPGGYKWHYYETYIFEYAYKKNIPILGICAGMQMMGYLDSKKYATKNNTYLDHHQVDKKYVHYINILDNTILKDIIKKDRIMVNSRHNEHIENVNNFIVSAISDDGIIEGIEDVNSRFVLGIQWHPESMLDYDIYAGNIYKYFIQKCKENRK
jgi:putative glutamine amidotransferase